MKRLPSSVVRVIVVAVLAAAASGCATSQIKPWQRGALAAPEMAWETDPLQAVYRRHVEFSKEASSGGPVLAGGGCGCN